LINNKDEIMLKRFECESMPTTVYADDRASSVERRELIIR